jgi:hypothetical protein
VRRINWPLHPLRQIGLGTILGAFLASRLFGGVVKIDFNTDPSELNLYDQDPNVLGNATWRQNFGFSGSKGDGYISITDAVNSQQGVLIFNDLENGLIVKAFTFDMDVRIGGATSSRPADGFSVNYASADDPVVTRADGFGWAGTDSEPGADHGGTGAGLPEEGTSTGLAVGFDEWQSGTIRGVQDVQGISLRIDGDLVLQWPVPISPNNIYYSTMPVPGKQGALYVYENDAFNHLAPTDPNYRYSLQTGPLNPLADPAADPQATNPSDQAKWTWAKLVWEHFSTGIDINGRLTVTYKGQQLTGADGLQTMFAPRRGRIVFGGRTGGANDNRHVDNIVLRTTPADSLVVGPIAGFAKGFSVQILDSGGAVLDPATVTLSLNGVDVSPLATLSKPAGSSITTVSVALGLGQLLPPRTTNAVSVACMDTRTPPVLVTGVRTFVTADYLSLDPAWAISAPASGSGFNLTLNQVDSTGAGRAVTHLDPNGIVAAENMISGGLYDPGTGAPERDTVNQTEAPGNHATAGIINFDYEAGTPGGDHFNALNPPDHPVPNVAFPGVDLDVNNGANNFTMVATSFLHLKPGYYRLVVNSDDGFDASVARGIGDQFGAPLAAFNGGRSASDTPFDIAVAAEGDYPFRLAYWQGTGGASCEFFSYDIPTGVRTLVNETGSDGQLLPSAIPARPSGHGAAYVRGLSPYPGWTGVDYRQPVVLTLLDDATSVDQGSITAALDGAPATPLITKTGAATTVTIPAPPGGWGVNSSHQGSFAYSERGATNVRTLPFNFTTHLLTPYDLPTNSFWIEAEDFNFSAGQTMASASVMPYLGGAFDQVGTGVYGVDFVDDNNVSSTASDYRQESDPNFGSHVPTVNNLGNRWAAERPGRALMNVDYRVGWTGAGQWMNYTRSIQPGIYRVYAGLSYGDVAAGELQGELDLVTSSPSGVNQSVKLVGTFSAPGSGAWGANDLCPMLAPDGSEAVLKLVNSTNTLRFNPIGGDFDFFILAPATDVPPRIVAAVPAEGAEVPRTTPITLQIEDFSTALLPSTVQMWFDGLAVKPTVAKSGEITTITYRPNPRPAIGPHTVVLTFDNNATPSVTLTNAIHYVANPLGTSGQFLIEAEDFDFGGGRTLSVAGVMPYFGLAFTQLLPKPGVDYLSDNGKDADDYGRGYLSGVVLNQNNVDNTENPDFDRGLWMMNDNYKIGWTDTNNWLNYTRKIPAGEYYIYAALSHGDPVGTPNDCRAALGLVTAGAGTPAQTVVTAGWFRGPSTGAWGANRLFPLLDSNSLDADGRPLGNPATMTFGGGSTTLRFNEDSGDFDFFLLVPAGSATRPTVSVGWDNSGTKVVVTFTGTLQSASSLAGPFTDVSGASSPYTPAAATGNLFYRSRN